MLRNEVVLVDIFDNELGIETKENAHKEPKLHRAFSIFIYNDNYEILIQKRAAHKYHSPLLWANTCCSHPKMGANVKESAIERLEDEVGIKADIEEVFSFIYISKYSDDLYEHELDHVFIGKYNGNIVLNPEEAVEAKWISLEDLSKDLVANPTKYSTWFISCAPRVIEILKNKRG